MEILFHYIVMPILMLGGIYVISGRFKYVSFSHVFIVAYMVMIYFGAISVMKKGYGNDMFLYSVWTVPFMVMAGMIFIQFVFKHSSISIKKDFQNFKFSDLDEITLYKLPYLSVAMMAVPVVYLLDKGTSNVALFFLFNNTGSFVDTLVMRVSGMESNISPILTHIYSYTYLLFYPLYISVLTVYRSLGRLSKTHYIGVLVSAAFFSVLTSEKAGLAFVVIAAALAYYYASASEGLDFKTKLKFILLCLAAVLLPALLYPLLFGFSNMNEFVVLMFDNLFRRIVEVPSYAAAIYFDAFPSYFDFLGPTSNRFLSLVFANGEVNSAAVLVNDYYVGNWLRGGLVNASFFASMYADWGWVGVWLSSVVVGCIISGLQIFYDRKHDLLSCGFKAATVVAIIQLMITNIYSVSLGRGMLSIPIIYIIVRKLMK